MKILLLNWRDHLDPQAGGAEIVTFEHARRWVSQGNSVTWITSRYLHSSPQDSISGVKIIRLGNFYLLHLLVPFYLLTNRSKYDVIVEEIHGIPYFVPFFTSIPVVVFIHEIADEIWDFMYRFPLNRIGKFFESLYFRFYKHCLFWTDASSTVRELDKRGIPKSNCTAIPCPITISTRQRRLISSQFEKEKKPTFIFVSRLVKMKGIEETIKAFAFIAKEEVRAQLWIVGGGDKRYIHQLGKMVSEYGVSAKTTFWGKVSEEKKLELMRRAHLLLHASVKEGWGLVVLEAASLATPAVVYDVPGLKDVVIDGETGIVIKNNSPQEMAREAVLLLKNQKRYAKLADNGLKRAARLNWEDAAKQSLELLRKAGKR